MSISRIAALNKYYHAPLTVAHYFEINEIPWLLNVTGLLPPPPTTIKEDEYYPIDLSPVKQLNLTLCLGKEWYRFPSHWLIPDGVSVAFIKSEFDGLLPQHFGASTGMGSAFWPREATRIIPTGFNDRNQEETSQYVRSYCHLSFYRNFDNDIFAGPDRYMPVSYRF